MRKLKITAIISYPVAVFLLWVRLGGSPQVFDSISFKAVIHGSVLAIAFLVWLAMVYAFATNFFEKRTIQRKLKQAERPLGNIATAKLKSYRHDRTGNFTTMTFYSAGIPVRDWESKRDHIQSAINYTIIEDIGHKADNYGIIIFRAKKGCINGKAGTLYDDEL